MGILSPEELEGLLEKEAGFKKDAARDVGQQIYRYIFLPVKDSLAALSGTILVPPTTKKEGETAGETAKEAPELPQKPDIYREPMA